MTISISPPFPLFTDLGGAPVEDGYIYISSANTNPLVQANQIAVYSDDALTVPVAQGIRTMAGFPVLNGTPLRLYVNAADYAIIVLDKNNRLAYASPSNKTKLGLIDLSTDVTGTLLSSLIKYEVTPAETAAAAVIINYFVPNHLFSGNPDLNRYGTNTTPGTTDMTAALNTAIAVANAAAAVVSTPGLQKSGVTTPSGYYNIAGVVNATGLGALKGQSRSQSILYFSTLASTINAAPALEITDLAFIGIGTNTAVNFTLAYLAKTLRCYFYNFAVGFNITNPSNTSTFCIWRDNILQNCANGVVFAGTVTTMKFHYNQFNTSTGSAITTGNALNFDIVGNIFEDTVIGLNINTQLVRSNIVDNWFEKAAAGSVTPYQDSTASPGFFTNNFIAANNYNFTTAIQRGVNNTWADTQGFLFSSISKVLNENDSFTFGLNTGAPFGPLIAPQNAACAAFTTPVDLTIKTQAAVASATSEGGYVTIDFGAGSGGSAAGRLAPKTDNVGSLGSPSRRFSEVNVYYVKCKPQTAGNLIAAATAGAGAKAFVSDATATTFASVVAGGGANNVPVYCDGVNWRIG